MPIAPQTRIDPLQAFMAGAFVAGTPRPCPLVATRFDVTIDAGLAVVATTRVFRNAEARSIEATMTFPLPVHAALFALDVRIADRLLKAHAQRRIAAREHYEDALDRGKTAVLHEEVLRGVHMLSVGHLPPGAEVEVRATWAAALTNVDGRGRLRIPLTVGDIYGRSGLADADELIHGGPLQTGILTVDCRDGIATLLGGRLEDRRAEIALNVPIDIDVVDWSPRELSGRSAEGRAVALRVSPYAAGDAALDAAVIVDRSGSMRERCSVEQGSLSKHQVVVGALAVLAGRLGRSDVLDLWDFDTRLCHIGTTRDAAFGDLVQRLNAPDGGTEIGRALEGVIAGATARDLLLVTDGKSHAIDVQALARSGRRFCVVLVGADSLEANVGHLAALTGGEIFVAAGPDLGLMLDAAIRALRSPHGPARLHENEIRAYRAGMELAVSWRTGSADAAAERTIAERAVAATAACILLPTLAEEEAAALAEAEGLVTHLTSLVLVDESAAEQPGIPATRKVALPSPATVVAAAAPMAPSAMPMAEEFAMRCFVMPDAGVPDIGPPGPDAAPLARGAAQGRKTLSGGFAFEPDEIVALSLRIDWDAAPDRLQKADLSGLDRLLVRMIRTLAKDTACTDAAAELGCDPIVLAIGILARAAAGRSRSAKRIARAILGKSLPPHIEEALKPYFPQAASA